MQKKCKLHILPSPAVPTEGGGVCGTILQVILGIIEDNNKKGDKVELVY